MSKLSLREIAQSQLDSTPVIDGQLIVCLDTGNAYRDTATAHVKIGSDLEVVSDLPLAPLAEKLYYLKPDKLYVFLGGNWTLLNDKTIDLDEAIAKLPAESSTTLNDDVEIITQDTDITQPHYYRRKLVALWEYIKTKAQDFFAAKNHKHGKADITDFPTSMPASDVYPWAKAATKPSYTKAEVGLGNVDNTADADKTVKRATTAETADSANYLNFTAGNEINFTKAPSDGHIYIGFRNGQIQEYRFCDGQSHGTLVPITAASFNGKATSAGTADNATNATTASKLSTSAGSTTQPVYFKDGVPVATSYALNKTVPADAKFTDTNTWRPVVNNLTSDVTDQSLSAAQGKVLKDLVDGKLSTTVISAMTDLNTLMTTGVYHSITGNVTNAPESGTCMIFVDWSVLSPFQLYIHDINPVFWKRHYNTSTKTWSAWTKLDAGIADVANSVEWDKVQNKPSTYPPASHNHNIESLTNYATRVYDATVSRTKGTVLAAPQAADGAATFRKLDKNDVGLENVDNTADVNKNVATAGIATTGVRDYNNANNIIEIGWSGADLDADSLAYVAGYTSDKKIHPTSKDGVRMWLGLGDSAYKNTKSRSSKGSTDWTNNATDDAIVPTMSFMAYWDGAYNSNGASNLSYCDRGRFGTIVTKGSGDYAVAGHTHNSVNDIGDGRTTTFAYSKAGMNYGDYSWLAGWNGSELRAVDKNQFATAGHTHVLLNHQGNVSAISGTATRTAGLQLYGAYNNGYPMSYGNVICASNGSFGSEIALDCVGGGGKQGPGRMYYRNRSDLGTSEWSDWATVAYLTDKVAGANHADSATTSNGVKDYNDGNRTIQIGYAGAGLNTSNLTHIAGYTDNGTKIKDVSKNVLTSWIGLGNYLPLGGGTMSGQIIKSTGGSWIGDRDRAAIRSSYPGDWNYGAVAAMGTKNGYWTIGNIGGNESLIFNYSTDSNYSAGKNETSQVYLPAQAGTIITSATINSQSVNYAKSAGSVAWGNVSGKPSTFPPSSHTHSSINSVGTKNAQTGRNQAYGNVYSYNSNASAHTGMPTTYASTIGFGQGAAGTVEICGEWTGGKGLWSRALRDYQDSWYDWQRIYTENYHPSADTAGNGVTASGKTGAGIYYVRFGNGTQMCWGFYKESDHSGSTSFPVAFNNSQYSVSLTVTVSSNNAPYITGRSTTGFSYARHGTSYNDVQWIAVGTWK